MCLVSPSTLAALFHPNTRFIIKDGDIAFTDNYSLKPKHNFDWVLFLTINSLRLCFGQPVFICPSHFQKLVPRFRPSCVQVTSHHSLKPSSEETLLVPPKKYTPDTPKSMKIRTSRAILDTLLKSSFKLQIIDVKRFLSS